MAVQVNSKFIFLTIGLLISIMNGPPRCAADDTNNLSHIRKKPEFPDSLTQAAKDFDSAGPTNRRAAAIRVSETLPKCPIVAHQEFETNDVGSEFVSYDYSKPSYSLSTNAIVALFGKPAQITPESPGAFVYWYALYPDRPISEGCLWVYFRKNQVVESTVFWRHSSD
jgi:hypothetical protein